MAFDFLAFLSALFGWVYTIAWSLSFYPQPLLNWRRRSTSGTTIDFPLINTLGFLSYLISNVLLLYSDTIRRQYADRHHGLTPTARPNDVAFALHALVLSALSTSMYFPSVWPSFTHASQLGRRPSRLMAGIMAGCVCGVGGVAAGVALGAADGGGGGGGDGGRWCWLDAVYALSYVKLVVTLVKYTPQLVANHRHASTAGWSIWQVLLDAVGGLLSIAQQALDSYAQRDWSGISGNPVKFALGNVSIAYDAAFMLQHYVLYPPPAHDHAAPNGAPVDDVERERLLQGAAMSWRD